MSPNGMDGVQWARAIASMFIVYAVVEVEKRLVDPVLMPIVRPVLQFIENHTPQWLSMPVPKVPSFKGCRQPKNKPVKYDDA
jgi:hypothetical protein